LFILGNIYYNVLDNEFGLQPPDTEKGRELLIRALPLIQLASSTDPKVLYAQGAYLFFNFDIKECENNKEEGFKLFLRSAELGYQLAQNNVGMLYTRGEGCQKDDEQCLRWTRLASDSGVAYAQYSLGTLYKSGMAGVTIDRGEAYKFFKLSADQGYLPSSFEIAGSEFL
jgi:TPR repeat protein